MTEAADSLAAAKAAAQQAFECGERGDMAAALAAYDRAIALWPGFANAHANRAACLQVQKRHAEAVAAFDRALALNPLYAHAHHNRGMSLAALGQLEAALAGINLAIELRPQIPDFHVNRGDALRALNDIPAALDAYDRALAINPAFAKAKIARSVTLLLAGEFAEGFALFDAVRWKAPVAGPEKALARFAALDPAARVGKTVVLLGERGLGDTIQFCRYARVVAGMGARVLLAPQTPLRALMRGLGPEIEVISRDLRGVAFDFQAPLMSMPAVLGTTVETIPAGAPYLAADPDRVARWARVIGREGFRIGVCWQGGVGGGDDLGRSFPAAALAGLAAVPGVRLVSLHKGEGEAQLDHLPHGMRIETLGADFDAGPDAFLDTAAVIALCDLVVTSDTSVAHLAGAMGAPVWLALMHVPEWRWLLHRADSPWYPSMTLFRQPARGDWQGLFGEMESELRRRLAAGSLDR